MSNLQPLFPSYPPIRFPKHSASLMHNIPALSAFHVTSISCSVAPYVLLDGLSVTRYLLHSQLNTVLCRSPEVSSPPGMGEQYNKSITNNFEHESIDVLNVTLHPGAGRAHPKLIGSHHIPFYILITPFGTSCP